MGLGRVSWRGVERGWEGRGGEWVEWEGVKWGVEWVEVGWEGREGEGVEWSEDGCLERLSSIGLPGRSVSSPAFTRPLVQC